MKLFGVVSSSLPREIKTCRRFELNPFCADQTKQRTLFFDKIRTQKGSKESLFMDIINVSVS